VVGVLAELRDIDDNDDDLFNDGNPFPIEYHGTLNSGTPDVCFPEFNPCIDEVRLRVQFCASLDRTDLKTLHIAVRQSLFEETGPGTACDVVGADLGQPFEASLAPGQSVEVNDGGLQIPDEAVARWSVVISNTEETFP
jgi:hypothetical protein